MRTEDIMDALAGNNRLLDRFAALRKVLAPPQDVSIFYGYSTAEGAPAPQPRQLAVDGRAADWWADYREDRERYRSDPVREALRRDFSPIDWRDLAPGGRFDTGHSALWSHLSDHGVKAAVSVPLHEADKGGHGTLSFIGFGAEREFNDWIQGLKSRLVGVAYLFHQGVQYETPSLSPRESECLGLTAAGLSAKEIGRRLSLSPRTVELHIARAIQRLGARNRVDAVARALTSGAIAAPR
ncbi:helix-turn-helix transcriptional regulator [Jannaschia seohaensis]|uniref:LuxR family transcriptional regulator n=1 Tax=Jannaschia seohaensis TaxID=475081 RepID=A0A2Y9A372_9RHOB|nr:LuxR family transcriptional regulator [Jannaschia seohaensis]PWJ21680.1 LuxR family transcriptional regulator [Jannaschia seohaensis]SSA37958.1 LuxR family transcriptional regulator [Jannaschia seohaensis]